MVDLKVCRRSQPSVERVTASGVLADEVTDGNVSRNIAPRVRLSPALIHLARGGRVSAPPFLASGEASGAGPGERSGALRALR